MWRYLVPVLYFGLCSDLGLLFADGARQRLQATEDVNADNISSTDKKNDFITSPQFPNTYKTRENRSYIFSGEPEELVQIIFHDFDFYKLGPNERCGPTNSFLSYKREHGNIVYICSSNHHLPILSETPEFILEYALPEGLKVRENFRGFNASYSFITNFAVNSGKQVDSEQCHFEYLSSDAKSGSFNSPNFPGLYPSGVDCTYNFRGTEKYLKLHFTEFNLLGSSEKCSTASDRLELTETTNSYKKYFDERRCGRLESFDLTVNASSFTVLLRSSQHNLNGSIFNEPKSFFGFRANYEFTNNHAFSNLKSPGSSFQLLFAVLCFATSSYRGLRISFNE